MMKTYFYAMAATIIAVTCGMLASCTMAYRGVGATRELADSSVTHKSFSNNRSFFDLREESAKKESGRAVMGGSAEFERKRIEPPKFMDRMVDDVWIIERPTTALAEKDRPRADLIAHDPDTKTFVPIPLKRTDVAATVTGFASEVRVKQRFHNPFEKTIEATYVFPLPHDSAVTDFIMTVGTRKIRGIIREREEAQRIYDEARRQGYRAALMTQERPNVFTQKVANIDPGEAIDVEILYFNRLKYENGEYEFAFPMVVGPRYNPADTKNPIVPLPADSVSNPDQVCTHYLAPKQRSGRDVSVRLDVNAAFPIESMHSPSHEVVKSIDGRKGSVTLKGADSIANRDFIVRIKLAGNATKHGVLTSGGVSTDGHVSLMIMPPADLKRLERVPREMIFVVDCSGSMSGKPMRKAKEAMVNCLKGLTPADSFQIIKFSSTASALGDEPIPATEENVKKGLGFVKDFGGGGGTEMLKGVKAALGMRQQSGTLRIVSFMTDGYIGNETQVLNTIYSSLGDARVFAFGVGSSVNRYLIEGMAQVGNGAAAYVGLEDDSGKVVDLFYERCAKPAMTNVSIDWGGLKVSEVYPKYLPDVFVGRPLTVVGKLAKGGPTTGTVTITGLVGGHRESVVLTVDLLASNLPGRALASVWSRSKLGEMSFLHGLEPSPASKQAMIDFSINQKVLCGHTAFIAVDASRRTNTPATDTVPAPTPMPDGVDYDKTATGPSQDEPSSPDDGQK